MSNQIDNSAAAVNVNDARGEDREDSDFEIVGNPEEMREQV